MIGIYALLWEQEGSIYIGQSQNIDIRFKEHVKALSRNSVTYNSKLQDKFNQLGSPKLMVLEECSLLELDTKEVGWIKEFDAINAGLNIAFWGTGITRGTIGPSAVYTKYQILKAFSLLYRTLDTLTHISNRSSVSTNMLTHISAGSCHVWLQEDYPTQYAIMIGNISLRIKRNQQGSGIQDTKMYPPLQDEQGNVFYITNVMEFCKNNADLSLLSISNLYAVLNGNRKTHKGFSLVDKNITTKTTKVTYVVSSPTGEIHTFTNISEFCRDNTLLQENASASRKGISSLLRRGRPAYKGWKLA
jgi:hypothetical protein